MATEVWFILAVCVAGVAAACTCAYLVRRNRKRADAWLPDELKGHLLAYAERKFTSRGERQVVARVDRAYRSPGGVISLVELKTRSADRTYLSDIIELSAQRVALTGENGEEVARVAWVVVQSAAGRRAHRVDLMSTRAVRDLASRREALLAGTALPMFPPTSRPCASCAFRERCYTVR
jgi:CRISPR-associated exonuclease Cas4